MTARRIVVMTLLLAGFAQTFPASAAADCAVRRGSEPPACSRCAVPEPSSSPSWTQGACCSSLETGHRFDPAVMAAPRIEGGRSDAATALLSLGFAAVVSAPRQAVRPFETPPVPSALPLLRTSILLI